MVQGFWFRVYGLGFRVSGSSGFGLCGFRISDFGFRISVFGFWVSVFGFRDSGLGLNEEGVGFGGLCYPRVGPWCPRRNQPTPSRVKIYLISVVKHSSVFTLSHVNSAYLYNHHDVVGGYRALQLVHGVCGVIARVHHQRHLVKH